MSSDGLPNDWLQVEWDSLTTHDGFRRGPFGGNLKKAYFVESGYAVYEQYSPINDDCSQFRYFIDEERYQELSSFRVQADDFLISCAGTMGKITQVPKAAPSGVINQALLRIRLVSKYIDHEFFLKLFRSPVIQESVLVKSGGGAIQNLAPAKELKQISFPLPPLAEQKVIAEKLDKLLAKVDSIKARLDAVPDTLKRFRQSVLAAAVSGKLTEEWRLENGIHWEELTLGKLAEVKGGKRLPKGEQLIEENTGFPYIRAGQLKQGTVIKTDDARSKQLYITKEVQAQISRYTVSENDLYITIVGASIGDAGVIPPESNGANLTENAAKLTDFKKPIVSKFLAYWLMSQPLQDLIRLEIKSGAQGKLALKRIKELPAPYTDIKEQTEIVRRVEKLFAYTDKVEAEVNAAQQRVNKLTQSILAKAFRGELTAKWREQNPELISGENSAEALLAKIKAEREKLKPKKKTRTKK